MTMDAGAPVPMWEVVSSEDFPGPSSFGGSNRVKRVTFRMANGDTSYVDVPMVPGWPARAEAEIEQAVQDHLIVLGLKSRNAF